MPDNPPVSLCIPSYNHAQFLPAAIDSALAQTYRPIEIVVADDGSSDGSLAVARRYAARHPDLIRVHTHPGGANRGISATVNLAYAKSRGAYWSGLPSDDVLYPDKVARQVEYLEARPDLGFVYGYADLIDQSGRPLPGRWGDDLTDYPD